MKKCLESKWISVKERLPKPDENVLLAFHGVPVVGLGINVTDEPPFTITHWMPIPEIPKEE